MVSNNYKYSILELNALMKRARGIIFTRDSGVCVYCGSSADLQVEHVRPKSIYNNHKIYNLVTACRRCNFKKSTSQLNVDELNRINHLVNTRNKGLSLTDIRFVEYICSLYYRKRNRRKKVVKPVPIKDVASVPVIIDKPKIIELKHNKDVIETTIPSDIVDVHINGEIKRGYISGNKIRIPSPQWGLISKHRYKFDYVHP